jgi:DNA-binding NarL/FixJ family response regulator
VLNLHQNLIELQGACNALTLWLHGSRSTWPSTGIPPGLAEAAALAFTDRQRMILICVADGKTNAEIAEELGCSRSTVKQELQRTMHSLGVSDRAQAAVRARQLGLIDTPPPLN